MELFRAFGLAEIKKINLKKNIGVTCNLPSGHLELVIYIPKCFISKNKWETSEIFT